MNTAHITGEASAIYGVGPTVTDTDTLARTTKRRRREWLVTDLIARIVAGRVSGHTVGIAFDRRYIVGGYADSVVIRANATRAEIAASVLAYCDGRAIDIYDGVGFWRDDTTGRVWLDSVRCFDTLNAAMKAARENGELAIWDRDTQTVLDVRYV